MKCQFEYSFVFLAWVHIANYLFCYNQFHCFLKAFFSFESHKKCVWSAAISVLACESLKMRFFWNGIQYKWIEEEKFNKNPENYPGYVIVRRLFVSALKSHQDEVRNFNFNLLALNRITILSLFHFILGIFA